MCARILSAGLVAIVTLATNDSFAGIIVHRSAQQVSTACPRADLVGLNPQPEPPSKPASRVNLVGLNPQPEPPGQLRTNRVPGRSSIIQHRTLRPLSAPPAGDNISNIDLQNRLQKQQQALQTLSNVSKTMHETSRSIIRNLN
jgi:hypothetical protein